MTDDDVAALIADLKRYKAVFTIGDEYSGSPAAAMLGDRAATALEQLQAQRNYWQQIAREDRAAQAAAEARAEAAEAALVDAHCSHCGSRKIIYPEAQDKRKVGMMTDKDDVAGLIAKAKRYIIGEPRTYVDLLIFDLAAALKRLQAHIKTQDEHYGMMAEDYAELVKQRDAAEARAEAAEAALAEIEIRVATLGELAAQDRREAE